MSFEDLTPQPKGCSALVPVKVGMMKMRSARARAYIVFRRDVLERLGGKCWRYRVALGKGENAHQVAVTQDDAGPFEARPLKGDRAFLIRLPVVDRFPNEKLPTTECPHHVGGANRVLVDLPSWAWKTPPKIGGGR